MNSVYVLKRDKYGLYFESYGKKRRLNTLDKNKTKYSIFEAFETRYILFS